MTAIFFGLLLGLQVKHFIADYLMQPGWILGGKGDLLKLGGYVHAAVHAIFSAIVLLVFSTPLWLVAALCIAEAIVHYILDFAKIHYSAGVQIDRDASRYWALHGIDQLLHQLTYAAMIYATLHVQGLA